MSHTAVWYIKSFTILLVVLFAGVIVGEKGLSRKKCLEEKRLSLVCENSELGSEVERLSRDIRLLRTDPKTIESVAKRKLGMIRADETIYLFEKVSSGNKTPLSGDGSRKGRNMP